MRNEFRLAKSFYPCLYEGELRQATSCALAAPAIPRAGADVAGRAIGPSPMDDQQCCCRPAQVFLRGAYEIRFRLRQASSHIALVNPGEITGNQGSPEVETYASEARDRLIAPRADAIWLHPGESVFDALSGEPRSLCLRRLAGRRFRLIHQHPKPAGRPAVSARYTSLAVRWARTALRWSTVRPTPWPVTASRPESPARPRGPAGSASIG